MLKGAVAMLAEGKQLYLACKACKDFNFYDHMGQTLYKLQVKCLFSYSLIRLRLDIPTP